MKFLKTLVVFLMIFSSKLGYSFWNEALHKVDIQRSWLAQAPYVKIFRNDVVADYEKEFDYEFQARIIKLSHEIWPDFLKISDKEHELIIKQVATVAYLEAKLGLRFNPTYSGLRRGLNLYQIRKEHCSPKLWMPVRIVADPQLSSSLINLAQVRLLYDYCMTIAHATVLAEPYLRETFFSRRRLAGYLQSWLCSMEFDALVS